MRFSALKGRRDLAYNERTVQEEHAVELEGLHSGAKVVAGPDRINEEQNVVAFEGRPQSARKAGVLAATTGRHVANAGSAFVTE